MKRAQISSLHCKGLSTLDIDVNGRSFVLFESIALQKGAGLDDQSMQNLVDIGEVAWNNSGLDFDEFFDSLPLNKIIQLQSINTALEKATQRIFLN